MKDSVQLFIDQRGHELRALIAEAGRVLATTVLPGPLDGGTLAELIAALGASSGRKPDQAHLLVANDQVKVSTYRLQEMPLSDVEKIVQRSITTSTGEREPIFRLTPLVPEQDKDAYLAEQIPRETITRLQQLFSEAKLPLATVSTGLQANLVAFAPHRDNIIQAQAIFDISHDAVAAIFISPTDILHHEIQTIPDSDREVDEQEESGRAQKRRLFAILNVIHGLYSQYMLANPLSPVEKVWLCGPGAESTGLDESLIDAMDIEVTPFDLLAGHSETSRAFTPLAGLVGAQKQVNFLPAKPGKAAAINNRSMAVAAGGLIALLLIAITANSILTTSQLNRQLATERSAVQGLQAAAAADQNRIKGLRFLNKLEQSTPPLYAIFKEISERLPREIELDGINLRQDDTTGSMEILAVTRHRTPWENKQIFTTLMAALDGVQNLECTQDPDIAMLRSGDEKKIRIKVMCRTTAEKGADPR
jgi:hypothetical protein